MERSFIGSDVCVPRSVQDERSAASDESFRSLRDDADSSVSRDEYEDCCSPIVQNAVLESFSEDSGGNESRATNERDTHTPEVYGRSANGVNGCSADVVEQPEVLLEKAEAAKSAGNNLFKNGDYSAAIERYDEALSTAPAGAKQRAVYSANRGACFLAMKNWQECVRSCTDALNVDDLYVKAIRRRMAAYEQLDELDRALADARKILEIEPGDGKTRGLAVKWEPIVSQRQEKMKDEVVGKLKDLGNSVLGRFGMSLDNFKMDKDPESGGYSIRFQQ
eukprot:jgi/Ulvmu1/8250/UM041_0061.1